MVILWVLPWVFWVFVLLLVVRVVVAAVCLFVLGGMFGFICFLVRESVGWRDIVLVYLMDVGLLRLC